MMERLTAAGGASGASSRDTCAELNDFEAVGRDLKAHHLAHQTFADPAALDRAIHQAVHALNAERTDTRWPSYEFRLG